MIAPGVTIDAIVPPAIVQPAPAAAPAAGAVLGRLVIPRLGLSVTFRHGVGAPVLAQGPGHYPGTSLPGGGGTIAIAGHRVTHTRPFLRLNRLRKGDRVVLVLRGRRYRYRVFTMRIVPPHQVWPLRSRGGEQLVLTACHPPTTDVLRLVVFARRSAG
jgi:sortase A